MFFQSAKNAGQARVFPKCKKHWEAKVMLLKGETLRFCCVSTLQLQPQETTAIGLQFSPSVQPLAADVLVFINDDLDQTEECFLVKTVFS